MISTFPLTHVVNK